MSKNKPSKKKVVVKKKEKANVQPTTSRLKSSGNRQSAQAADFPFSKNNFLFMGIGVLFILLGMLAMAGGAMPDPDTWDADRIYGFRRTVLAPILILIGLGIEIYAIFKD